MHLHTADSRELQDHRNAPLPWFSVVAACFFSKLSSVAPVFADGSITAWGLSGDLDFTDFSGVPPEFLSFKLPFLFSVFDSLREREDFRDRLPSLFSWVTSTAGDVWVGVADLFIGVEELSLCSEPDPASLCGYTRHYSHHAHKHIWVVNTLLQLVNHRNTARYALIYYLASQPCSARSRAIMCTWSGQCNCTPLHILWA